MPSRKASHSAGSSPGTTGRSERMPCLMALSDERSLPASVRGPVLFVEMLCLMVDGDGRYRRWRLAKGCGLWGVQNSRIVTESAATQTNGCSCGLWHDECLAKS